MGNETELKFEINSRDLRKLKAAPLLHRKPWKKEKLVSVYFDTTSHKLAKRGLSLRVRHNGETRVQTIKAGGANGSFDRGEWEHKIKGDVPNLSKGRGPLRGPLLKKILRHNLKPIFETRIQRTSVLVHQNGSRIEVALDAGKVRAGRRSLPVCELELELKGGKGDSLFKLAREIMDQVPAKLVLKSKSERGYDLIANTPTRAVRAAKITFQRGMSTAVAFRIIGQSILRHIASNDLAVRRKDSEGVHQMRVGLRRLRATISLFSELLDDTQTARIKTELKWLTDELAPARDLDVYEKSKVELLRAAPPAKRGMKELADALASKRATAFDRAKTAVESSRYRSLLLDTLQWLENGEWAKRSRRPAYVMT
jgi:triphosphatase